MSKPTNKIELSKIKDADDSELAIKDSNDTKQEIMILEEEDESKMEIIRLKQQTNKKRPPIDKQSAFVEFKGLPEGKVYED